MPSGPAAGDRDDATERDQPMPPGSPARDVLARRSSCSSSDFASLKSAVSNPSVNPIVDRGEQRVRLAHFPRVRPQPTQARRRAQLQRLCPLALRNPDGLEKHDSASPDPALPRSAGVRWPGRRFPVPCPRLRLKRQHSSEPMELRIPVPLPCVLRRGQSFCHRRESLSGLVDLRIPRPPGPESPGRRNSIPMARNEASPSRIWARPSSPRACFESSHPRWIAPIKGKSRNPCSVA